MNLSRLDLKNAAGAGPAALAVLVYAGQLKQNPMLEWFPGDLTLMALMVVILMMIISRISSGPASGKVILPFMVWAAFFPAVWLAPSADYAQSKVSILFSVTLVLAVAPFYILRTMRQRRIFLVTLVLISVFAAVYVMFVGHETAGAHSTRRVLAGTDTIGTARIAMTGAMISIVMALSRNKRPLTRLLWLGIAILTAIIAVSSGSRGPLIGVLAGLFIVILLAPQFKRRRAMAASILVLAVIVVAWLATAGSQEGFLRAISLFTGESDASTRTRALMWSAAWRQVAETPLGSGWGGYDSPSPANAYPHNLLLEIAVEAGLFVAVIVMVLIIVSVIRYARFATAPAESSLMGLLAFAFTNALVSSDINGGRLLIVCLFAAWSLSRQSLDTSFNMAESCRRGKRGILD